ncbi:DUF5058 family protein [Clostridium transplantifaecale]|uniref:DUF5058 family protein n=1 Tax=Clostridium transplantifaecale TaxID=2479838 RepID=UPI000F63EE57|nr:DUF5058 family protein [Clostridium transplantifaecale]
MSEHLSIANSTAMAALCGLTILVVLIQPVLFSLAAVRRAKELDMDMAELKTAAKSSSLFSVIPSLPILISYLLLVPFLGRFFPWLRLSVVGSAAYETMVANMAAEAFGLESMSVPNIPAEVFIGIVFVVSIGILGGNLFNVIFLKMYDRKVASLKSKNAAVVPVITTAMFLGMYSTMAAPHMTNFTNISGLGSFFIAGACALAVGKAADKVPGLKEFAFPASMIAGMLAACLINAVL